MEYHAVKFPAIITEIIPQNENTVCNNFVPNGSESIHNNWSFTLKLRRNSGLSFAPPPPKKNPLHKVVGKNAWILTT